jgi:hypothetical protein
MIQYKYFKSSEPCKNNNDSAKESQSHCHTYFNYDHTAAAIIKPQFLKNKDKKPVIQKKIKKRN